MQGSRKFCAVVTGGVAGALFALSSAVAGPAPVTTTPKVTAAGKAVVAQPKLSANAGLATVRTLTTAIKTGYVFVADPRLKRVPVNVTLTPEQQNAIVPVADPTAVDLHPGDVKPLFDVNAVEAKGQWVTVNVMVKNEGPGCAYRVDVLAQYAGGNWLFQPGYLPQLKARESRVVSCRIQVPRNASLGQSTVIVDVDPKRVNKDADRKNNRTYFKWTVIPERLPDLTLPAIARVEYNRQNDYLVNDAFIRYYWNLGVLNAGTAGSVATTILARAFKLTKTEAKLVDTWPINVPALAPGQKVVIATPRLKCPVDTTHEVVAQIDPDNLIRELRDDNNEVRDRVSVKHKNEGLANFISSVGKAFAAAAGGIGDFFTDLGEIIYKGIKYAGIYATASIMWPAMTDYIYCGNEMLSGGGRALTPDERKPLEAYFPGKLLDEVRINEVAEMLRLEFCAGGAAGVTYPDVICILKGQLYKGGKFNADLVAHELVHAYQYKRYGLAKFTWDYLVSWIENGFTYRDIKFEREAYGFIENCWDKGNGVTMLKYLGY